MRIRNWDNCAEVAKGRRRKLENNTYLRELGDNIFAIRLHATDIVTYHPDGTVVIDSGGWHSMTTADRVTRYSPINMFRRQYKMYVNVKGPHRKPTIEFIEVGIRDTYLRVPSVYPFIDGIAWNWRKGMTLDGKKVPALTRLVR